MREAKHYRGAVGFFDTHAHLYDDRFQDEGRTPGDVLLRASEAGVTRILIPADNIESSMKAVEYRNQNNGKCGVTLYSSVGYHPHEAKDYSRENEDRLLKLLTPESRRENGIMAIGEIGLDYYYDLSPRDVQRDVFRRQLEIAKELDIPFILHERDATQDCITILKEFSDKGALRKTPGVCHCCSMSAESAEILIRMGFYIGVDGPLTFKNNKKTTEVVMRTPKDRLVIETDSPYLTPEPNRGLMNESEFVPYVALKVADLWNLTAQETAAITTENGLNLYGINE